MRRPLPRLLSSDDLPEPELRAAVLDGELYAVGDRFSSVADVDDAWARAHSVMSTAGSRTIAARRTAAWIWGGCAEAPRTLECVVSSTSRGGGPPAGARVSEVQIDVDEVVRLPGDVLVTSPARTVLDLLRGLDWSPTMERLALAVLVEHAVDAREVLRLSRRRPAAPGRAHASVRLAALVDPVPC